MAPAPNVIAALNALAEGSLDPSGAAGSGGLNRHVRSDKPGDLWDPMLLSALPALALMPAAGAPGTVGEGAPPLADFSALVDPAAEPHPLE